MIYCPYLFINISPSMHVMIYAFIYSRTSKGLSLGELIRAFYIINFITYIIVWECYLHCYINVLHVLDNLWDFHTKSLFLVFNIWEAEYPPFFVFIVSGVSRTQIIKEKNTTTVFLRKKGDGKKTKERKATRPKRGGARGTHQTGPRALPRLGLFMYAFVFPKKGRPNFSRIISGRGGGGAPDSLRRGSDPAAPELRRGGKSPPSSSPLLLGVGGGLYITVITITSTISIDRKSVV